MFHIIGMNLSLALFGGNVSMVLSEFQGIRVDRHLCAAAGICTNFFYTAAAILLMMESHAIFKATTTGIIGGRTRVSFQKHDFALYKLHLPTSIFKMFEIKSKHKILFFFFIIIRHICALDGVYPLSLSG